MSFVDFCDAWRMCRRPPVERTPSLPRRRRRHHPDPSVGRGAGETGTPPRVFRFSNGCFRYPDDTRTALGVVRRDGHHQTGAASLGQRAVREVSPLRVQTATIDRTGLDALIVLLRERWSVVVGPTVRDGAIVFDEIDGIDDLPAGWTDEQDAGTYRLHRRGDGALFGYAVGPHSWKRYLFPPRSLLWRANRAGDDGTGDGFAVETPDEHGAMAFFAVRGCDLAAIGVQDRVFLGPYTDPTYD